MANDPDVVADQTFSIHEAFAQIPNIGVEDSRDMTGFHFKFGTISVVNDQRNLGRMASFQYGSKVSIGRERKQSDFPTFNTMSYAGTVSDPVSVIGGAYLLGQTNVQLVPITKVSYEPIERGPLE